MLQHYGHTCSQNAPKCPNITETVATLATLAAKRSPQSHQLCQCLTRETAFYNSGSMEKSYKSSFDIPTSPVMPGEEPVLQDRTVKTLQTLLTKGVNFVQTGRCHYRAR